MKKAEAGEGRKGGAAVGTKDRMGEEEGRIK